MRKIHMVDLVGQYSAIKHEIDVALAHVLESATYINGHQVKQFAHELAQYLGCEYVIPCANGTDAITVSLMSLGLQPGDEVVVPDFTFIAPVEAVSFLGLVPLLVDVDPTTFSIDCQKIRNIITPKTKAVIAVHLFGQPANIEELASLCREYNLHLIEDVAQSLGSSFTYTNGTQVKAGTAGIIGCTSFFPTKNLGCYGDGGALITNDQHLAEKIRSIVNHGSRVKYHHEHVGLNSRLDTIQAAVLLVKLKYLDQYNSRRQELASYYDNSLGSCPAIHIPARQAGATHVFNQYTIKVLTKSNIEIQKHLATKGIPSMIYYQTPVHAQPAYQVYAGDTSRFPVASALCHQVISLPIHTDLDQQQQEYICQTLLSFVS